MTFKILIVDDEPDILEFVKYNLNRKGYVVETASNGGEAILKCRNFVPDLVLLDLMMPVMDGFEVCKYIKSDPVLKKAFVIFLTAKSEEESEIKGFDLGADDFITKPIKPNVLLSRIKAILNRKLIDNSTDDILKFNNLIINKENYSVKTVDSEFNLPKKEFELLYLLATKVGKVQTREKILSEVWGDDVLVVDRTIDVHIRKIREKIGDNFIQTIKGVGYKFSV